MTATWLRAPSETARCSVIGEVAQAHDGSLGMAHAFVDAIADAGADAVKFQTHIAAAESTPSEPWRVKFSRQDATRYEYWKRMEFTAEQWAGLKAHAEERGLVFLSSPFSMAAVDLLESLDMVAWKVASGEVGNKPMLDRMASGGRPVILSSGMSDLGELDKSVSWIQDKGAPLAILQCATRYPCPPEAVGLNNLAVFKERYGCAVGLSDHSAKIYPGLAAASLGAQVIEVHVTLSRKAFGPDVVASLLPEEFAQLCEGVRFTEDMLANPVDKTAIPDDLHVLRRTFMKSIYAADALAEGTILQEGHLVLKKPGTGLPPEKLPDLIGRRLTRALQPDEALSLSDVA